MKHVYIVHGFEGKPNGAWRPWLMSELEKLDVYACALPMPSPYTPQCEDWMDEISRHVKANPDETYLIGHSLGVVAILNYLQTHTLRSQFAGVILISGPIASNPEFSIEMHNKLQNFFFAPFNFSNLKNKAKNFCVIHGDNDPVVPFSHAQTLARGLNCELVSVKNGGHLNGSSGFYTLPILLEKLKSFF